MVKTTLAWKYLLVKPEGLTEEALLRLLAVALGQVSERQRNALSEKLFAADLEALRASKPDLIVELTPWGLGRLDRALTALTAPKGAK